MIEQEILGHQAGNVTYGHRFMAPKAIRIATPARVTCASCTSAAGCMADVHARRESIRQGVTAAAAKLDGIAVIDDALLDEVTGLVEWPVPLAGRFDAKFLELPAEVPIATMQDHQRYFPVRDAQGRLMPWFITVSNIESRDPAQVIAGNERVVRPRLTDAAFFYRTDRQHPLSAQIEALQARHLPDPAWLAVRQVRTRTGTGQLDRGMRSAATPLSAIARRNSASATCSRTWSASSPNCRG